MKKLNQKGMTTIELLVCFIMISILSVSLYSIVASYKEKQQIESYKSSIITYKDLLTKEIQDDFIIKKITTATINGNSVIVTLGGGTVKQLVVDQKNNTISYGSPSNLTKNPLPDIGSSEDEDGKTVYDLQIASPDSTMGGYFNIVNGNILRIYIPLTHPDLENKYAIDIIAPLNFS